MLNVKPILHLSACSAVEMAPGSPSISYSGELAVEAWLRAQVQCVVQDQITGTGIIPRAYEVKGIYNLLIVCPSIGQSIYLLTFFC